MPEKAVGLQIYYSPDKDYFIATDEGGNPRQTFGFKKFRDFVDHGVVSFMSPGVELHMMGVLDAAIQDGRAENDDHVPGLDGKPQNKSVSQKATLLKPAQRLPEEEPGDGPGERADGFADAAGYEEYVAEAQANAQQGKTPPKDPTRRLPWFFAVILILSIIAAVIIAKGPQLAELAAPILSMR